MPGSPILFFLLVAVTVPAAAQAPTVKEPLTPSADQPQAVKFETGDRVTIAADYYAADVKKGDQAPVAILIHMYPADRSSWAPLVPGLRKAGFAVLAYDIRGHGGSTEPADKKLREAYDQRDPKLFADAWKDVEAAKKWLAKQPGCDVARVALVGASIGCSISLDYAGRDEAVKAVVCLSPGTKYMGVDSIAHIKKCAKTPILLISPEGEYAAVEELLTASGGKAKGEKYTGGEERHATRMFDAPYGKQVMGRILEFVKYPMDTEDAKAERERIAKARLDITRLAIGSHGVIPLSIDMYKFQTGVYPLTLDDLLKKPQDEAVAANWKGPYLEDAGFMRDTWGNPYRYQRPGKHNQDGFDLWSIGPDGKDGTEDDIGNW